jgi:hypothetical protein
MKKRNIINVLFVLVFLFVSPMCIFAGSISGTKKTTVDGITYQAMLSTTENRPILIEGYKEGPLQAVAIAYSGDLITIAKDISRDPLGNPVSKTKAVIEPKGQFLILKANITLLNETRFSQEKLSIEFNLSNGQSLVGTGSTYYLPPKQKNVQVGGFFVSTADSWCSITVNVYPEKHTIDGEGCVISDDPQYEQPKKVK